METKYSREEPVKVESVKNGYQLNYNVREASEEELLELWQSSGSVETEGDKPTEDYAREHKYAYNALRIPMGRWNYSGVVEAIIRDKYSIDQMEAITNNMAAINAVFMQTLVSGGIVEAIKFLKESADTADTETFREMQEWRAMAKKEAKAIFVSGFSL